MTQIFDTIINPLLIKELRQFVRNKFIIILINVYVLTIVIACLLLLTSSAYKAMELNGSHLLFTLANIIFIAGFLTIIVRTAWSTAADKINEDLMFYSSMKPSTIVFGKVISGVIFTLLIMSVTMPFVTLAYLLRGIDLEIVFIVMIELFIIMQALNCFAILVASSNKLKGSTYMSTFIVVVVSSFLYCVLVSAGVGLIYFNTLYSTYAWDGLCILFSLEFACIALFICGSIAMLSPPTSNRILPIRILLTAIFLASVLAAFSELFHASKNDMFMGIEIISLFTLGVIIVSIACERDQWSTRIRRSLPKSLLRRILLFPFYTGAACGIVWFFMMLLVIFFIDAVLLINNTLGLFGSTTDQKMQFIFGCVIFSFDYSITAMLIRSSYLKKSDSKYVAVIALILLLIFTLGSMLLYFFIMVCINDPNITVSDPLRDYSENLLSALNPFCDFGEDHFTVLRIYGMMLWSFILFIPLLNWYKQRLGSFNSSIEESITYDEACKIIKDLEESQNNNNNNNNKIVTT
ncbi:MAG: hypothetical protein LBC74_13760 [Planctomycetaceae bacterium]|jgi:hypothetical protein|nr:hypothetical protein [Planctomycetaceae bacterium]